MNLAISKLIYILEKNKTMNLEILDGTWYSVNNQYESITIKNGTIISIILGGEEKIQYSNFLQKLEQFPTGYFHFCDINNKKQILLLQPKVLELYEIKIEMYEFDKESLLGRFAKS